MHEMSVLLVILTIVCSIHKVTAKCPTERYGQSCQHVCHCARSQRCDTETGCAGRCDTDNGWDGPTCQRQNVVLRRPVVQGPRRYCEGPMCFDASNVVDGRTGHNIYSTLCSLVESSLNESVKAWWNVTLDQEYYVYRFTLYNRMDAVPEHINGFVLSVGRSSVPGFDYKDCYRDSETGVPPAILNGTCINKTPLKGDVIQVKQTNSKPLTMCELLVYVCAAGWYGDQCDYECSTTTTCARCDVRQLKCEECVAWRWSEHCFNTCYCLGGVSCDKSGRCPRGDCAAGYKGDTCNQTCDAGEYGPGCLSMCGFCFVGRDKCNVTNGHCPDGVPRCQKGYQDITCEEECPIGQWDFECSKSCGNCRGNTGCNKETGICPQTIDNLRCKPGYIESDVYCLTACLVGDWGDNCVHNCSENCAFLCDKNNGACVGGCLQGYTGEKCDTEKKTGSSNAGIIGGSVVGVVAAIIISVVVVIFWRLINLKHPTTAVSLSHVKEEESPRTQMSPNPPGAVYQNTDLYLNPIASLEPTAPASTDHRYSTLHDYEDPTSNTYMTAKATPASVPTENVYEPVTDDAN